MGLQKSGKEKAGVESVLIADRRAELHRRLCKDKNVQICRGPFLCMVL